MVDSRVIRARNFATVDAIHREVRRLRLAYFPEVLLQTAAVVLAIITISAEISQGKMVTWHTDPDLPQTFTIAGLWAMLFALPILNYIWLRLGWKIFIWTRYLYRITRIRLILVASHPDRTGGIGFISRVQAKYAIVIFAYGVSNIAAVVAYKVGVEGASLSLLPVWFPIVGFVIGAPLLFTLPLCMFTKQLYRTKKRALRLYRRKAMGRALGFEQQWLGIGPRNDDNVEIADLAEINSFGTVYSHVEGMRVVPFDLQSAAQLFGATIGSVASALPLLGIEGRIKSWLDFISTLAKNVA